MAIPKKKMAGKKPATKKAPMRKAQDGTELPNVNKRETVGEALKGFYNRDYLKADSAKTKAGKALRKAGNTAIKAAFTPHQLIMAPAVGLANSIKNRNDISKMKKGGKISKKKK